MTQSMSIRKKGAFLNGTRAFLARKRGQLVAKISSRRGNETLIAVIILICVVIGLCTVFRNQIYALFTQTIFPGLQSAASGFLNFSGGNG